MTTTRYCRPLNAGLASENRAVARRIGKLLTALDQHINRYVCEGQITEDLWQFRQKLMDGLRADGWGIQVTKSDRWSIKIPQEGVNPDA